jgi:sugar lactone lactonase YvrE
VVQTALPPKGTSPSGTTGSFNIPCAYSVSLFSDQAPTSYPMGIAVSSDAKTAYVVLDNNDTLTKIDLTAATPVEGAEIRVGNVPHSVLISPDGKTAYVSNEAGRIATADDFHGIFQWHPGRRRISDRQPGQGHHFGCRYRSGAFTVTGDIKSRPPPDRHGPVGQEPARRQYL